MMPSDVSTRSLPALMREASHRTEALLERARRHFAVHIARPEVRFDLRGKAAGQVRMAPGRVWQVRYNLPTRRLRRFDYHCACRTHQLTSTRHYRALAGQTYTCVACREPLRPGPIPRGKPDLGAK
jgi:predicted SprT family Zn-dependent metalloprotease